MTGITKHFKLSADRNILRELNDINSIRHVERGLKTTFPVESFIV